MKPFEFSRNLMGAFSDGAILFPLLILLSQADGFSVSKALATTGATYLLSAFVFRVPMSVQPLKSIAVASIVVGASFTEIRSSGFLLGLILLGVGLFNVEKTTRKIPESLIHQLQAGLGVLLVLQGVLALGESGTEIFTLQGFGVLLLVSLMVFFPEVKRVPILGLVATGGFLFSLAKSGNLIGETETHRDLSALQPLRPGIVLSLLLPQLALTSANSVLATRNVCERYFGPEKSARVTVQRLLRSIGLGNILVAFAGGMPFCHGSGGVTAHVRGGASHAFSTAFFGLVLIGLSVWSIGHGKVALVYPQTLISSLLIATGIFHLRLMWPTLISDRGWLKIALACGITWATRNLLWTGLAAIAFELLIGAKDRIQKRGVSV